MKHLINKYFPSIIFILLVISVMAAPFSISLDGISSNNAYAFSCPDGGSASSNSDGTFTCIVNTGSGELPHFENYIYNADGTFKTSQDTATASADCSTWWYTIVQPTCWARGIATVLGTGIIWLTSWVLTVSGLLFDWAVTQTILQFGQFINQNIINAINLAWSAFRDISNIVIIGMFTFIAIATILGNVNYGAKKMISKVLIVAVLINFSLLFAKIIIDASNFTAVQFFNAASSVIPQTTSSGSINVSSGTAGTTQTQNDIAGAFITYAGASHIGDTYAAISSIAQNQNNGGWIALTYGVVIGVLEMIAAIVLLYGTFLLISRALLMIFLMITASVAFASYLLPSNLQSNYGWNAWWSSLLKNAVFAPLLAVLLWATLTVAQGFHLSQNGAGSLGALIANPQASIDISALFGYLIVIGLLFISFKISSSFATSIGGLSFGQGIWNRFTSGALSGGSSLGGLFKQQTLSRFAYRREATQTNNARKASANAAQARIDGRLADADKFEKAAQKNARSAVRYGNFGGDYRKKVQERAGKVATVLQRAQVPAEEREAQVKAAQATARTAEGNAKKLTENLKEVQKESVSSAKIVADEIKKEIQNNPTLGAEHANNSAEILKQVAEENAKAMKPIEEKIKKLGDDMSRAGTPDSRKQELQKQLLQTEESRKSELRHQAERVEKAQQTAFLKTATGTAASEALKRNDVLRGATEKLSTSIAQEKDIAQKIGEAHAVLEKTPKPQDIRAAHAQTMASLTDKVAAQQAGFLGRLVGTDNEVAKSARIKMKADAENHRLKQALSSELDRGASPGASGAAH